MRKGGWNSAKKSYSVSSADYRLLEEVGQGASATVYRAMYVPYNEIVAVKSLDLDRCNSNLDDIRREAQTMSLIDHPNVVKAYCSFVVERFLWVVMPFLAEGSCLHLMKIAYPDGFEENVIGSILKETLKALEYLHKHGHIHRDVKAGNILLDSSGVVKLADFGVSAHLFDKGDRQRSRNTFVGTPCWMAPEVLQPGGGYDFKADIWSFGITALELAHGHAPFSKYPPMKVLLMTLQNAPPGLDYDRDKKFSKSFKEMVAMCLVKDQTKRPTAEKLLKHSFFKNAKPPEMYVKSLLVDLPPLWDRVKELEIKDAAQLAMKRMPSSERQALSQSEYQRGVSAWNFDVEDLKVQASLIEDDEDLVDAAKEDNGSFRHCINNKESSISRCSPGKTLTAVEITHRPSKNGGNVHDGNGLITKDEYVRTGFLDSSSQVGVNGYDTFRQTNDSMPSTSMQHAESQSKFRAERRNRTYSDPLMPSGVQNSSSERGRASERIEGEKKLSTERSKHDARKPPNIGGPSLLPKRASSNSLSAPIPSMKGYGDSREDKSGANVVQIKGRFSVTSENVDLVKRPPLRRSASYGDFLINPNQVPVDHIPKENISNSLSASILVPHLQNLFQQTSFQQDLLTNLLSSLQQNDLVSTFRTGVPSQACRSERDRLVKGEATEREQHLHRKIAELEARMISLIGEMTETRLKQIQLQQQLKHLYSQEDQIEDMPKRPDLPVVL